MRIKIVTLALLASAAVALPVGAANAQAKIRVVNVARLLQEAPQAQAASQALENEFATRRGTSRTSIRTSRPARTSSRRTAP